MSKLRPVFYVLVGVSIYSSFADAAPPATLIHSDTASQRSTQRYCVRHRHGTYWHSCSDTRHPVYDRSHFHTGLPPYNVSDRRFRSTYGFYFGVKSGSLQLSSEDKEAGLPKGVLLGIGHGEYAMEFEANSISAKEFRADRSGEPVRINSSVSTSAIYTVRRIGDDLYTKMKLGISRSRTRSDTGEKSDSQLSAGLGFGLNLGTITLESEYTFIGSKAKFFSVGASIMF